jgi:hypothetical protein
VTKPINRQDLSEKVIIKKIAHALTVLAVAWVGVSVFAMVAYKTGKEDADLSWVAGAIWAWRIHALIVLLAISFWIFEKPSGVRYIEEDPKDKDV